MSKKTNKRKIRPAATRPTTASGPTPAASRTVPPRAAAPAAPVGDVVEVLHGVAGPPTPTGGWRTATAEETAAWVAAQNARTRAVLDALPQRPALHQRLLELLEVGVVGAPAVAGDRVFTSSGEATPTRPSWWCAAPSTAGAPARVVVDPHGLAADHAAAIDWFSPSPDGRLVAYGVSEGGSEHGTLRIVEVDTGTVLPDAIPHVRHPSRGLAARRVGLRLQPPPRPGHRGRRRGGLLGDGLVAPGGRRPAADDPVLGDGLDRTALPMAAISADGRWLACTST